MEKRGENTNGKGKGKGIGSIRIGKEGILRLRVPLSIGTLQWGTTPIDQHILNPHGCLSETDSHAIGRACRDAGVSLFDTAEGYGGGTSEKRLGRVVADVYSSRTEIIKTSSEDFSPPLEPILMTKFLPVPWRYSHSCFESALRSSLKRLGVDRCPIYMIHSPVHWRPIEYWVESAAICRRKGLLLTLGLSNCNANQVRRAVAAGQKYGVSVVVNQVHYSLLDYNSSALKDMESACKELGVTIVAYSPIGQGLLTDKMSRTTFPSNRPAKMLRLEWDDMQSLRACIRRIADAHGERTSMAQVAINWCICHGTVPLVGCRSVQQAEDSLGALGWSLTDEEVKELDSHALGRSTLESSNCRRMIFVALAGLVMLACQTCDIWGYGLVKEAAM